MTDPQLDWRRVVAALADDRVRAAYARIVLGESLDTALVGMTASAREKVTDTLSRSGLVVIAEDGSAQATGAPFRALLRRRLVDEGLVERTRSGSSYARAS